MLSPENIARRRHGVGASEAAAICGIDPWRSPYDVWVTKVYDMASDVTSDKAMAGHIVEPALLDYAESVIGEPVQMRGAMVWSTESPTMFCTLDGSIEPTAAHPDRAVVQAKSTGHLDGWGEPGSDEVPPWVRIQVHHEMDVIGARVAYVPVAFAVQGLRLESYVVPRDDALAASIRRAVESFWANCVVPRVAPSDCVASMERLKRIVRSPGKVAEVDAGAVREARLWGAVKREAERREKVAKAEILQALGDAEEGISEAGRVTYYEQHRGPVGPSRFRVLRLPKSRGQIRSTSIQKGNGP